RGPLRVELDYLPAVDARELAEVLPEAKIEDAGDLFRAAREVRLPQETALHRRHTRAAERAIQIAFAFAAEGGITERQIYARMQDALLTLGGGVIPFLTLSSGPERTYSTHNHPSDRVAQPGDLLLVDMVGFFSGLYTDMARTAVVGEATAEQKAMYRRARGVQQEVMHAVRPGMTAGEAYEKYLRAVKTHGASYTYRYAGHSTGYQVVEEPVMTTGSDLVLRAGMVLCVEVKDRIQGVGAVQLEEMFLLTDHGPEQWTDLMASNELPEIR
ncbi:MAG: aminopeptidase P family protein, partial [Armatimonadetes bacterium]|nr:aminopeptidase P family protein [Armatimonadota bacterium]